MKQFIKTTLALIAILLPATAMAYDIEVDGIFYDLNGNEATVTYDGVTAQNSYSSDVIIPETINYQGAEYRVTAIGKNAFNKCDSLLSIVIPNSVTTIGEWAFAYCTSLTEVIIPNSVNHIGNYAFYNCSGLSGVTLPESLTTLPNNLFAWCTALTNIEIPSTVTSIGWGCFSRCNFTEIKIPSALTQIDARAFADCLKLETVHITDLTSWCTIQFENELSNPLFWADHLYLNGEEIKNLVIPDDVTTIGKYAFYGSDIETVDFGHSVTTISDYAFSECAYLHNFVIPQNVTTIGNSAFYNCLYYLTSVEIPNSVTSIGEKIFGHCMRLTTITVANDNPVFDSRDNCNAIIETATNTLITGCNSTIIPNTVTSIGNTAMYECFKIRSIEIPNSVTIIGKMAFYGCTDLKSINIPNSVTSIGDAAFSWCTSANRIVIPESVTEIGNSAFAPTDYKKIVKCYVPTPLPIDNYTFDRYNNAILRVPTESIELYKSHEYWSKFKNIRPVENIPGDIDDDGVATVKDLAALIQMMLAGNLTPDIGDVNGDGVVDMKDLADLINMLLNS